MGGDLPRGGGLGADFTPQVCDSPLQTCSQTIGRSCDLKHETLQPVKWTKKLSLRKNAGEEALKLNGDSAKRIQFLCRGVWGCLFCFDVINDKSALSFKRKEINKLLFLYQLRCQVVRDLTTFLIRRGGGMTSWSLVRNKIRK